MEKQRHKRLAWLINPATALYLLTFSARTPNSLAYGMGLLTVT